MHEAELEFESEIDGRFPYRDFDRCRQLIRRGVEISPRATFAVLHEICRPPASESASAARLLQLLDYWSSSWGHPLAPMMQDVARSMILKCTLSGDDVLAHLNELAKYPGLYPALEILYFSCDDIDGRVEALYASIQARWVRG